MTKYPIDLELKDFKSIKLSVLNFVYQDEFYNIPNQEKSLMAEFKGYKIFIYPVRYKRFDNNVYSFAYAIKNEELKNYFYYNSFDMDIRFKTFKDIKTALKESKRHLKFILYNKCLKCGINKTFYDHYNLNGYECFTNKHKWLWFDNYEFN